MADTVLLVEDDAMFRETVRDTLAMAGYQVLEANDGVEGVERVRERRPDLILLDFDLPRMMGDEALEQMLKLRPGLVCYVLSGKDDLNQALRMGRRGAYGWIDKYVGTERLLALVAEGTQTRPRGLDLARLVANCYPQPVAAPWMHWKGQDATATAVERLAASRELYEGVVEYLGAVSLSLYLNRGLLDDDLNAAFLAAMERVEPAVWIDALELNVSRLLAEVRHTWQHELASALAHRLAESEIAQRAAEVIGSQTGQPAAGNPKTVLDLLRWLSTYWELWRTPERLPEAEARDAAAALEAALDMLMGGLTVLADVELCWVEETRLSAEGDYQTGLAALLGSTTQPRHIESAMPLKHGELYLVSRVTGEPLAPLGPLMTYGRCDAAGRMSHGVFMLSRLPAQGRATYLSHSCGQLRWVEDRATLDALRRVQVSLNPRGARHAHQLEEIAVGLFDLSGFTPLTREHGPAVARELVRRMVAAVRDAAHAEGGTVGDPVGDEVLAYFHNPLSAVRAALALMRSLEELNRRSPQTPLVVHVGMDYGPGIIEDRDVWGDVINRAKRCQSLAGPGEVVISPALAEHASETTAALERIDGELKGFGHAEVYRMQWRTDERTS